MQLEPSGSWRRGRADEFFEIGIGKTPPRKEPEWFSDYPKGNVKWLSIKDMGEAGAFALDSSEYLTPEAVSEKNVRRVPAGAVLVSFKLTVGRVKIAGCPMTTNEAIACFNADDKRLLQYVYPLLLTFDYSSLGSTSSIATAVNSKTIKGMPVAIPGNDELQCFSEKVTPLYEKMLSCQKEIVLLSELRNTLLPKLMSGEIDVSKVDLTPLNNHLPERRPALQNCFHRARRKGAPDGSDDQYGPSSDAAGTRLSAAKATKSSARKHPVQPCRKQCAQQLEPARSLPYRQGSRGVLSENNRVLRKHPQAH